VPEVVAACREVFKMLALILLAQMVVAGIMPSSGRRRLALWEAKLDGIPWGSKIDLRAHFDIASTCPCRVRRGVQCGRKTIDPHAQDRKVQHPERGTVTSE
jgi:hypothetical protein